ncbi:MAG: universal stress protein [Planctomycetota bacterium]
MPKYRKIVVPTDFSAGSQAAFAMALELAKEHGSEIVLVHVVEPPVYPGVGLAGSTNFPAVYQELRQAAEAHMQRIIGEEVPDGMTCRAVLRDGRPFHEVVELAAEEKADLIVIATHGYTGLKHFMLGSTAERVVRLAGCPVLTCRPPAAEGAA